MIFIAAGFDGHRLDPLGRTELTERCYRDLSRLIADLSEAPESPPVLLALEGGYNTHALAECVREVLNVFAASYSCGRPHAPVSDKGLELVEKARIVHGKYGIWTN